MPISPHDDAAHLFRESFGRSPDLVASAPGRINLIGEHTDYELGLVLPLAIDRRLAVALGAAPGSGWSICSGGRRVDVPGDAPLAPTGTFADHVLGVAAELEQRGAAPPPAQIAIASAIPIGAGLASSAALEVAAALVLARSAGVRLRPTGIARLCRSAEHSFAGTPCGIMDMLVAVAARQGHALLIDCRSETWRSIALPDERALTILVADSGVRHELAAGAYAQRRGECRRAAEALGVRSLREASSAGAERLPEPLRSRALHVISENQRVERAAAALAAGDLDRLGALLLEGHASLRDRFAVSCPELETIVAAAAELRGRGVFGARMTGAGFGGSCVILVEPAGAEMVRARVVKRFAAAHGREPEVYAVRAGDAARLE